MGTYVSIYVYDLYLTERKIRSEEGVCRADTYCNMSGVAVLPLVLGSLLGALWNKDSTGSSALAPFKGRD